MRIALLLLISLLFISCGNEESDTAKFENLIRGDWQRLHPVPTPGEPLPPPPPMNAETGFGFYQDGVMESKTGFFKDNPLRPVGFESTYRIVNDSLIYHDPGSKEDSKFKINLLTKDSLVLDGATYKRVDLVSEGENFDALLFKTGGMALYIDEKGSAKISGVVKDKYKFAEKKFTAADFKNIRAAFMKAGYQQLLNEYHGDFYCDDCLETDVTISFFKNGKVIKIIADSGQGGPMPFLWACLRVQYLPYIYKLSFEAPPT